VVLTATMRRRIHQIREPGRNLGFWALEAELVAARDHKMERRSLVRDLNSPKARGNKEGGDWGSE
jgi:hypothetical protein